MWVCNAFGCFQCNSIFTPILSFKLLYGPKHTLCSSSLHLKNEIIISLFLLFSLRELWQTFQGLALCDMHGKHAERRGWHPSLPWHWLWGGKECCYEFLSYRVGFKPPVSSLPLSHTHTCLMELLKHGDSSLTLLILRTGDLCSLPLNLARCGPGLNPQSIGQ